MNEEQRLDCCAAPRLEGLAQTIDRVHEDEWVKRCTSCGQHWYSLWREDLNCDGGDDPWWMWFARLTPEEAQRLVQAKDRGAFEFLRRRRAIAMDATDVWSDSGIPSF